MQNQPSLSDRAQPGLRLLVTGGAGFIGSNFILHWLDSNQGSIINLDKLTYSGNLLNVAKVQNDPRYAFVQGDINDQALLHRLFREHQPDGIVHFAAESHVDRSIDGPAEFVHTNVNGTFTLLRETLAYWRELAAPRQKAFRFLHVSTDEVFGSLGPDDPAFDENTQYRPNSPYSASKAASDHLVRAYHHTYGLPVVTTNCSNNYGPFQFPEKLIPLMILNAMSGKPLPVYGDGANVRDWLYVLDHCEAIRGVFKQGRPGDTYTIGGKNEMKNIEVVHTVCEILDELLPESRFRPHKSLITYVKDRPGHDRRYAVSTAKIEREIGWTPREDFASGIRKTVQWYLENDRWIQQVTSGEYRNWMERQYGKEDKCEA